VNLPRFSGLSVDDWTPVIQKETFPKEFWPSQMMLGQAGTFLGVSGLIQMPTSAGKTRSIEMILRSAFMSGRTSFAIVVAPFRALSHEISQSLLNAFKDEEINVDELSDAFQPDYLGQFMEILGADMKRTPSVVVLTPEKLLYVLRQNPEVTHNLGLIVYDEGHQFDAGYRGVTYELLLTEIKRLLSDEAQTVLISAVIQNAEAIAHWLINKDAAVISGQDLLPTSRSVAFASWSEKLGQMQFYEGDIGQRPDYFVPRVIQEQELNLLGKERKPRIFPAHGDVKDVALYIGLNLAPNGAVAVFCGRKDTANKIISRSIDIFARGLNISPPSAYSDTEEIRRLGNLFMLHFGKSADSTKAAKFGIYAHHGNTPHGIRLAVEYAMQQGLIKFVACTSTLAQGVNLPIRYLILSSVQQGAEKIRIRDFHNLMGRAGRSGMHTEGLVIFADTRIYDGRYSKSERWRFKSAIELLDPTQTEPTSSSLLTIFKPFYSGWQEPVAIDPSEILNVLLSDSNEKRAWAKDFLARYADYNFNEKALIIELNNRRKLITALENYLMANRGESLYEGFIKEIDQLVAETLAFSLADDAQKTALITLFLEVAKFIENREPEPLRQAVYAKTLLGVEVARNIEEWVHEHEEMLQSIKNNSDFIAALWGLLAAQLGNKFVESVHPESLLQEVALMWIAGEPYHNIFNYVEKMEGKKPWGDRFRNLNESDVINFCENTLGFQFPLGVAAITQFLYGSEAESDGPAKKILHFHKALKYGMPDELSISCYEFGFSDRMLAQRCAESLLNDKFQEPYSRATMAKHQNAVRDLLADYPSYFNSVLNVI